MSQRYDYDAVIVGSGPNGLAAAITLAEAGASVLVLEARDTIGGGTRSAELTLPGFVHDICSAIHPLALASPIFRRIPLSEHGLEWIHPPAPMSHPLDGGHAAVLERSLERTVEGMGAEGEAYLRLMAPLVRNWEKLIHEFLGPLRPPRHPLAMMQFGLLALRSANGLARAKLKGELTRALFAGAAAHAMLPLETLATSAVGLIESALGHAVGFPMAKGGSQRIADAMASYLRSLGGEIQPSFEVTSLDDVPPARTLVMDITPRQLLRIAGDRLPGRYRRQLEGFRYGLGVFKVDWALAGPVPWAAEATGRAATIHVGGTLEEIAAAERAPWNGEHPERPFVILVHQTPFDPSRAPAGKHTAWGYCHVPNGSTVDMTERIERQIERFAPGFRDLILARHTYNTTEMEAYNPNYVGGDINGGVQDLRQLFTRPVPRLIPYSTPVEGLYLCSSSTPPGGGVHGMCGHFAARAALRELNAAPRSVLVSAD